MKQGGGAPQEGRLDDGHDDDVLCFDWRGCARENRKVLMCGCGMMARCDAAGGRRPALRLLFTFQVCTAPLQVPGFDPLPLRTAARYANR